jgi:GH43 family beta-xylosidase
VPAEKIINIVIKNKIGIDEIKKNWTIKCKTVLTSLKLNKEQLLFKISNYKIVGKY